MGLPSIYRPSPLAYPGSRPGFDPSHPAAQGIVKNRGFSLVSSGANFISLLSGQPLTVTGSLTSTPLAIGPTTTNNATSGDYATLSGQSTTSMPNQTLATVIQFSAASQTYAGVFGFSNYAFGTASGNSHFGAYFTGGLDTGISAADNIPYFYALSIEGGASYNAVVVNLSNGKVSQASATTTLTPGVNASPTILKASTIYIDAYVACMMQAPTFLSMQQLLAWAADPWAFWYPRTLNNLIFSSLCSPTSGSVFSLSLGNSSYSFTGDLSYSTITASDAAGSYALTGDTATPAVGLLSSSGSYATTGSLINAVLTLLLTAGAYAFSGVAAILFSSGALALTLAAGAYALTGTTSSLLIAILLAVIAGSYASAGALIYTMITALAAAGSYALTGAAATLLNAIRLAMIAGSYASAGASIVGRITMQILSGAYAIVGDLVDLTISIGTTTILLFATAGSYILSIPVVQRYFPVIPTFIRKIAPSLSQVRQSSPTLDKLDV